MAGRRTALIVATDSHTDHTFQRLRTPAQDAASLAEALAETSEYRYEVTILHNAPAAQVTKAIESLLLGSRRDDVFLLYFSGHGIRDDAGNLYLATIDSEHLLPGSTMVAAQFIRSQLDHSRCGRKIVLLDCCFGGAFPRGQLPRGKHRVEVLDQLTGQGCAILTASTALEFAYEPDGATGPSGDPARSYFTSALVDGLRTGAADLDGDGWIDSDELHRYVADELRTTNPRQNPSYDCKFSGRLVVAPNPRGPRLGFGLPDEIVQPLRSPLSGIRLAATHYLLDLAAENNAALSHHARATLDQLALDTNPEVRATARTPPGASSARRRFFRTSGPSSQTHAEAVEVATRRADRLEFLAGFLVNLTRRSQALVTRQLHLLDSLEADEQDPGRLVKLFELDHLATRARRNLENMLVLSGADLHQEYRRSGNPVPISDVLGAAVAEIEQYGRVEIGTMPRAQVLSRGVNDLVHMLAELLDNATAFSAPESRVSVRVRDTQGGELTIQIVDDGIGLDQQELDRLNQRLAVPSEIDESATHRLGLYVVAQLARRHNVRVRLRTADDSYGVTAQVILPADLVTRPDSGTARPGPGR